MARKYRLKPKNDFEAITVREALELAKTNWRALPAWLNEAYENGLIIFARNEVKYQVLGGIMTARANDWLIQGLKGDIEITSAGSFSELYEQVPE